MAEVERKELVDNQLRNIEMPYKSLLSEWVGA